MPSLIARPTLTHSQVIYEDTPLILAITQGHILVLPRVHEFFCFYSYFLLIKVVDEADKAQLEVVCVLKGIVDGELALPDGRIICKRPNTEHSVCAF